MRFFLSGLTLVVLLAPRPASAQLTWSQMLAREIFKELIEINTTDSVGDNTAAANAVAKRLLAAGFPADDVRVLGTEPRKGNLVARLRGTGSRKPILLLAHLDVVEARRKTGRSIRSRCSRTRRILLRPRHERRQGSGRHLDRQPDSIQAGRLCARSRSDRGTHRR